MGKDTVQLVLELLAVGLSLGNLFLQFVDLAVDLLQLVLGRSQLAVAATGLVLGLLEETGQFLNLGLQLLDVLAALTAGSDLASWDAGVWDLAWLWWAWWWSWWWAWLWI